MGSRTRTPRNSIWGSASRTSTCAHAEEGLEVPRDLGAGHAAARVFWYGAREVPAEPAAAGDRRAGAGDALPVADLVLGSKKLGVLFRSWLLLIVVGRRSRSPPRERSVASTAPSFATRLDYTARRRLC